MKKFSTPSEKSNENDSTIKNDVGKRLDAYGWRLDSDARYNLANGKLWWDSSRHPGASQSWP